MGCEACKEGQREMAVRWGLVGVEREGVSVEKERELSVGIKLNLQRRAGLVLGVSCLSKRRCPAGKTRYEDTRSSWTGSLGIILFSRIRTKENQVDVAVRFEAGSRGHITSG